jgi:copper resistance protein B
VKALCAVLLVSCAAIAGAARADEPASEHVPPDPPRTRVHAMPYGEMAEMMGMDDRARFLKVMLDELEWVDADEPVLSWDAAAWYGGDAHKIRIETEGERAAGDTHESRTELLWDRIATRWWNTRLGLRHDGGIGPAREWLAFGVAGLAPGFVELEASAYLGDSGRTALRVNAHYDLMITQRLVLQPEAELEAYGARDAAKLIGSGVSGFELGLRLRYEFRRELAPYIGLAWRTRVGRTADLARAAGEAPDDLGLSLGIRAWF